MPRGITTQKPINHCGNPGTRGQEAPGKSMARTGTANPIAPPTSREILVLRRRGCASNC
jgi:hypothetical protein